MGAPILRINENAYELGDPLPKQTPTSLIDFTLLHRPNGKLFRPGREQVLEFAHILQQMMIVLRDVETAKISLCTQFDFTIIDAFRMLKTLVSVSSMNVLTKKELSDGLMFNLEWSDFSADDIYVWFKRIDRSLSGQISYA